MHTRPQASELAQSPGHGDTAPSAGPLPADPGTRSQVERRQREWELCREGQEEEHPPRGARGQPHTAGEAARHPAHDARCADPAVLHHRHLHRVTRVEDLRLATRRREPRGVLWPFVEMELH